MSRSHWPQTTWRPQELEETTKGIRLAAGQRVGTADIAAQSWNALRGDLELPVLVLHEEAMRWNIATMSSYCAAAGVELAPHAKTSMSPQITSLQIEAGAWAVTAATPSQVRTLVAFGARRVLLANVLVDTRAIEWVVETLLSNDEVDFMCYVDSLEGVVRLEKVLASNPPARPLKVLLEVGYAGGRSGARSLRAALAIGRRVQSSPSLRLVGVAGFEGLVPGTGTELALVAVADFLGRIRHAVDALHEEGLFDQSAATIVTAGGSAYFDQVASELGPAQFEFPVMTVLRSGCYVTHDHGVYEETSPLACRATQSTARLLKPALELLASVWSRPEPGLVIAGFGRRDVPTDERMPVVLRNHSALGDPGSTECFRVVGVNDQHAFIQVPTASRVAIGDVLGLGISHPCGAFDRWRFIPTVSPTYDVIGGVTTHF